jgi:hypothetical protein
VLELGFTFPTPVPIQENGHWIVRDGDIDWAPLEAIKKNEGPETARRLGNRRRIYNDHRWVRETMVEHDLHAA